MSAVIHARVARPAVPRSPSVGRRPAGNGTFSTPWTLPAAAVRGREVDGEVGEPFGPGTTSSSRKAIHSGPAARQPTLRAAAGPTPARAHDERAALQTADQRRSGPWPVVDDDDLVRGLRPRPVKRVEQRRKAGRPIVGITMVQSRVTRVMQSPWSADHERADREQVDRERAEALQRVARAVDHRAARGVEAGVDDDGQPGPSLEAASIGAPTARVAGRRSGCARCRRRG